MKIIGECNPDHIKTAIQRVGDHVMATLRYTNGLSDSPPSPCNLSGLQIAGIDLTGVRLTHSSVIGANLNHASLDGVMLDGADLTRATLIGANLNGTELTCATLTRADLTRATLIGANLGGADLDGANLTGAMLVRADLFTTKLTLSPEILTVNFQGAENLRTAEFYLNNGRLVVGIAINPQTGRLVPEAENSAKSGPKSRFQATAENMVRFAEIYPDLLARARRAGYLLEEAAPAPDSPPAPAAP